MSPNLVPSPVANPVLGAGARCKAFHNRQRSFWLCRKPQSTMERVVLLNYPQLRCAVKHRASPVLVTEVARRWKCWPRQLNWHIFIHWNSYQPIQKQFATCRFTRINLCMTALFTVLGIRREAEWKRVSRILFKFPFFLACVCACECRLLQALAGKERKKADSIGQA